MVENETMKIQCLFCNMETNHEKLWSKKVKEIDDEREIWAEDTYEVYQCLGCEHITFRVIGIFSEDFERVGQNDKGEPVYDYVQSITYYPMRTKRMIKEKDNVFYAPPSIRRIYHEIIESFNNELMTVCALGIRAIIEAICIEENIMVDGLNNKIDELIKKGIVTPKIGEGLQETRLIGNETAHQLEIFGDNELRIAIQLIENVIDGHYTSTSNIDILKNRKRKGKS